MRQILIAAIIAIIPTISLGEGLAILPVKLLDTSGEFRDQQALHEKRQALLAEAVQDGVEGAVLIDVTAVASCQPETTSCLLRLAGDAGADRAVFMVVQKSSTLILQIFANIVDVETGQLIASRSLGFRGDNDEAWLRAGRFLARQMQGIISD